MQVAAKCIMAAYDSVNCISYKPGQGPLPGGLYEIDRNGPLATLKTSGGPMGKYVFEFDRNAGPDDKPHDYSCKRDGCGKKFKTLAALGTHTREEHNDTAVMDSDDEPVVMAVDGRGKKQNKTFTCKEPGCGEVLPHLYALKLHKKTHEQAAVEQTA
jgi:hypothetical protein